MARKRLNGRQLETLRWISRGCPDGEQAGTGYKLTAQALQSRRLARVSRRHGEWTVEITADGQYYLDHADYPPAGAGIAAVTKAAGSSKNHSSAVLSTRAPSLPQLSSKTQPRAKPPSQGDLLIAELVAAGGRIVVHQEYGSGAPNWPARISSAARSKQLPAGKYISYGWCQGGTEILLKDIPAWRTEIPAPVPIPDRLVSPHPVVAALREGKRTLPLSKAVQPRALRILQAIVTEVERRGYKVKLITDDKPRYKQGRLQLTDLFTIHAPDVAIGVAVSQQHDNIEHIATAAERADAAKQAG